MPVMHNLLHRTTTRTHITEGSPVHELGAYYHAGRGGAGNCRRLSAETFSSITPLTKSSTSTSTSSTSTSSSSSSSSSRNEHFFGGRGGAGNAHPTSERAIFSFDEELERERWIQEHSAPVFSVGRGGAGNIVPASRDPYDDAVPSTVAGISVPPRRSVSSEDSRSTSRSTAESLWKVLTKVRSNE